MHLLRSILLRLDMEIDPDSVIERLENNFPNAKSELEFKNPLELLIATILSAQCTDARVNKVTPILFKQFPTPQKMSKATHDEISKIIFSTGFYNQKAKKVIESSKKIVEDFFKSREIEWVFEIS